jgi:predicted phosphoribosyltransferase
VKFADLADGGRQLAELLPAYLTGDPVLVGVPPGGVPVGAAVAEALGVDVTPLVVERGDQGVRVEVTVEVRGRRVIVVDDGVETGTAARAVALALREAGAAHIVLAVPVCPREAEVDLARRYDVIVAVTRPLVRRSLRWHYETFG